MDARGHACNGRGALGLGAVPLGPGAVPLCDAQVQQAPAVDALSVQPCEAQQQSRAMSQQQSGE
jgi:hypothetical protein